MNIILYITYVLSFLFIIRIFSFIGEIIFKLGY